MTLHTHIAASIIYIYIHIFDFPCLYKSNSIIPNTVNLEGIPGYFL